jgi:hypothetical protein
MVVYQQASGPGGKNNFVDSGHAAEAFFHGGPVNYGK